MNEEILILLIIIGIICAIIHKRNGYSIITGFLWGFVFSIVGLLVVISERTKAEQMEEDKGQLSMMQWLFMFLGIGILIVLIMFGTHCLLRKEDSVVDNTNKSTNELIVDKESNNEFENQEYIIESLLCQKNTYYSIIENYKDNLNEILEKYCTDYALLGDSAVWLEIESNYEQYEQGSSNSNLEKYVDIINIQIAKIHESTFNLENYNENLSLKDLVKLQSEEGIDYTGELIGKDGYFEITGMLIMNGNNTSEEDWKNNSRAKKIVVIIDDEEYGFDLQDTMDVQLIDLNYRQESIDKPIDIEIKIVDVYEGDISDDVFISDIRFGVNSSIHNGR